MHVGPLTGGTALLRFVMSRGRVLLRTPSSELLTTYTVNTGKRMERATRERSEWARTAHGGVVVTKQLVTLKEPQCTEIITLVKFQVILPRNGSAVLRSKGVKVAGSQWRHAGFLQCRQAQCVQTLVVA